MPSSAESDDLDPKAHCHDRTAARSYHSPRERQREKLGLCRFCFPDGEIQCREDEIVVSPSRKSDAKLHRVEGSEGTPWKSTNNQNCDLSRMLRRDDVTSTEDLAKALEESGA